MSGIGMRIGAAVLVLGVATLLNGSGVSAANADDTKAAKPKPSSPAPLLRFVAPDEFGKVPEQVRKAMEALAKDPSDPAVRKMMGEAWSELMKGMTGGFPGLDSAGGVTPERPRLGVQMDPMTALLRGQLSLDGGVAIAEVVKGSPAEKAGFRTYDILVEFAGKAVSSPADVVWRVGEVKSGETVGAAVIRKGKRVELKGIVLPEAAPPPKVPGLLVDPEPMGNGRSVAVSMSLSGDSFALNSTQDDVRYHLTGKVAADGAKLGRVTVTAGDATVEATDLAKVPEKYRGTVEKLLKLVKKPGGKASKVS